MLIRYYQRKKITWACIWEWKVGKKTECFGNLNFNFKQCYQYTCMCVYLYDLNTCMCVYLCVRWRLVFELTYICLRYIVSSGLFMGWLWEPNHNLDCYFKLFQIIESTDILEYEYSSIINWDRSL